MAYIIQGFGNDQRIQLGAEEIIRPMVWGTNWSKIRIGMRVACNTQVNFLNGAFSVGVCQGNKGFCDTNATDVVAVVPANNVANVWGGTWTWNSGGYVSMNTSGNTFIRKVGNQWPQSSTSSSQGLFITAQPSLGSVTNFYFIDITKVGNLLMRSDQWGHSATTVLTSTSRFFYLYQLENETPVTVNGSTATNNQNANFTATGSAQLWDNVCIGWSRSVPVMEISDITVLRFY